MHNDPGAYLNFSLLLGPLFVSLGLRQFYEERLISKLPLSKINSAALGPVALMGRAQARKPMPDPLSGLPCCWWRCVVEEYISEGKNSHWRKILTKSSNELFYIQDATGMVAVDPEGAEFFAEESTIGIEDVNRDIKPLLISWGVDVAGFWGAKKIRIKQTIFYPKDPLYVLGDLSPAQDRPEERRQRFHERLQAAKRDPQRMADAGVGQDGTIDERTWDAFRMKLEGEFLKEEAAKAAQVPDCDKRVVRKPADGPMIMSDKSETELAGSLRWKSRLKIFGGLGLCALGWWWAVKTQTHHASMAEVAAAGLILGYFASRPARN
jgi:hypothetical protein